MPVIKYKVIDIVVMYLSGFIYQRVRGTIQVLLTEAFPFLVGKDHLVEALQLGTDIGQECRGGRKLRQVFVALSDQILNKFAF